MASGASSRGASEIDQPSTVAARTLMTPRIRRLYGAPPPSLGSEGDLVVNRLVEIGLAATATPPRTSPVAVARGAIVCVIIVLHAETGATPAAVEHGQRAVKALQYDFGGITVLAILTLPLAGLQLAFDVNFGPLLEVLLGHPAEPLVEDHHRVPLGLLAPLAARLVAPGLGGGNAQVGDRSAVLRTTDLGISAEIADQDDFVDGTGHETLLLRPSTISAALVSAAVLGFAALLVFAARGWRAMVCPTRCGAFLLLSSLCRSPARDAIRDPTIAAIGDPRALPELLVH